MNPNSEPQHQTLVNPLAVHPNDSDPLPQDVLVPESDLENPEVFHIWQDNVPPTDSVPLPQDVLVPESDLEDLKVSHIVQDFTTLDESKQKEVVELLQSAMKSSKKRKRDTITPDMKKEAVAEWEKNGNFSMTARILKKKYGLTTIDESYIRRYVEDLLDGSEISKVKKKGKLTDHHQWYPELEASLTSWFRDLRQKKVPINRGMIRKEALSIFEKLKKKAEDTMDERYKEYRDNTFTGSAGWITRWLNRAKISRRMATHTASTLATTYIDDIASFLGKVRKMRMEIDFEKKMGNKFVILANMDETPIYFDMGRQTTYHWKGERSIHVLKTTGYRKRVTVCLAALSNGEKLPPLVIFKGTKTPDNPFRNRLVVGANDNAWITEKMMGKWVQEIWNKARLPPNSVPLLLIDKCSSHKPSIVLSENKQNAHVEIIPGGCTSLVQPLDLAINKPFKEHIRRLFEDWLSKEGIQKTNETKKKKNIKAPSRLTLLKWIEEAWTSISKELIIKSFQIAGNLLFY